MENQRTAVMVDSGGDLPYELCKKEGIFFLPLHVIYPEKDYFDGIDIDPQMIYDRFPEEIPSTSTPSIGEAEDMLLHIRGLGLENVIAITISARLSSTGNTIAAAAAGIDGLRVHVFDTKNISAGSGVFALWAARKLRQGWSFDEVVSGLYEKRGDSRQFFYMDTLKYLRHGGRIGRVSSIIGETLRIRPIISCDAEGVYYTAAKIRGKISGTRKLVQKLAEEIGAKKCWTVIGGGGVGEEVLKGIETMLREKLPNMELLFVKQITATLANNTGPGLLGVMAFANP